MTQSCVLTWLLWSVCTQSSVSALMSTRKIPSFRSVQPRRIVPKLQASGTDLNTNYEWLAEERGYDSMQWMDASSKETPDETVPLYPLDACHLPSSSEHVLNNVRPRTIRMVEDLMERNPDDRLFCATLFARDTGRVVSVGTLLLALHAEEEHAYDGSVARIILKCRAVSTVRIVAVRTRGEEECLLATVVPFADEETREENAYEETAEAIAWEYAAVRAAYVESTVAELPPWVASEVARGVPPFSPSSFSSPDAFWDVAEAWQTLCNTVREVRRALLRADLDEISVRTARATPGPLYLPVKRETLSSDAVAQLEKMERDAHEEYLAMGMDPCLEFQHLLSAPDHLQRLQILLAMITRERNRLDAKKSLKQMFAQEPTNELGTKDPPSFQ